MPSSINKFWIPATSGTYFRDGSKLVKNVYVIVPGHKPGYPMVTACRTILSFLILSRIVNEARSGDSGEDRRHWSLHLHRSQKSATCCTCTHTNTLGATLRIHRSYMRYECFPSHPPQLIALTESLLQYLITALPSSSLWRRCGGGALLTWCSFIQSLTDERSGPCSVEMQTSHRRHNISCWTWMLVRPSGSSCCMSKAALACVHRSTVCPHTKTGSSISIGNMLQGFVWTETR